ncbi:uncharacterized protein LOC128555367 [Mercenaria mercenaria]|uniref:uncharacterized protein LOC128555367 n=1 Tax=Mercenaria mercenaria TaxID=6596 RepID=UPI00234E825F|nr:uncharacterized protein LOC128555367 [Mercenaria mercenaria]
MPCFAVNTKLGTAMIDRLGGPRRVNNILATLNLKTVSDANLKKMEIRAGSVVEKVSAESSQAIAEEAFKNEMETIAHAESQDAQVGMSGLIEDLGICPLPDSSPVSQLRLHDDELDWTDTESDDENSYINMLNRMFRRLPLYQITVAGIGHGDNVDVEQIPDSIPRGNFKPVQLPGPPTVISLDLETTGLIKDGVLPHITQIAAVE